MTVILPIINENRLEIKDWLCFVLGVAFFIRVAKYLYTTRKLGKLIDRIAGPNDYLIARIFRSLGFYDMVQHNDNYLISVNSYLQGLASLYEKEKMFRLWILDKPLVFLYGAELAEPLVTSKKSINKASSYKFLKPWLGNGLLTSSGDQWRSNRKLLSPSFHFKILEDFLPLINEHSLVLVKKIHQMSHSSWIDIVPLLTYCTLDVISETAMGVKLSCQEHANSEYADAVKQVTTCLSIRWFNPWLRKDFIYNLSKQGKLHNESLKIIQDMTAKVIKEKKEAKLLNINNNDINPDENQECLTPKKRMAFLDLLLETHYKDPTFTDKKITDEVNTFMFAGHDTTSTSLTWMLYVLGLHPEVQEKLYEEINDVIEQKGLKSEITLVELRKLKYMDMVIKECRRLYPTVPSVIRRIDEDLQIGDKLLPKGTQVLLLIQTLHKDKEVFPNPEQFNPERFSDENSQGRHPLAFIPFSAGPRNCIGQKFAIMEEKVILSHIILNFKLRSLDQRDKINVTAEIVLKPVGPIRLKFDKR